MSTESSPSKSISTSTNSRATRSNTKEVSNVLLTLANPITTVPASTPPRSRTKTVAARKRNPSKTASSKKASAKVSKNPKIPKVVFGESRVDNIDKKGLSMSDLYNTPLGPVLEPVISHAEISSKTLENPSVSETDKNLDLDSSGKQIEIDVDELIAKEKTNADNVTACLKKSDNTQDVVTDAPASLSPLVQYPSSESGSETNKTEGLVETMDMVHSA
ncbi:hypothetical protein A2U01_0036134, partial [Trifolium medium]|nr:hypothetical protein [Trifolium medium]